MSKLYISFFLELWWLLKEPFWFLGDYYSSSLPSISKPGPLRQAFLCLWRLLRADFVDVDGGSTYPAGFADLDSSLCRIISPRVTVDLPGLPGPFRMNSAHPLGGVIAYFGRSVLWNFVIAGVTSIVK